MSEAPEGERLAQCACGRLKVRVRGEPFVAAACHCDFCQKQSGSIGQVIALFHEDQIVDISGESNVYNGLEIDGVGMSGSDENSVSLHFCGTCGSTVYRLLSQMPGVYSIGVGSFVDRDFPPPTIETWTALRHDWVAPIAGAAAYEHFPES
jgi:hypothetical protein